MGYWPSNILIVFGIVLNWSFWIWRGDSENWIGLQIAVCGLAYHHWQAHATESEGLTPTNDRIRLAVAIGWTVLAGAFLWLN